MHARLSPSTVRKNEIESKLSDLSQELVFDYIKAKDSYKDVSEQKTHIQTVAKSLGVTPKEVEELDAKFVNFIANNSQKKNVQMDYVFSMSFNNIAMLKILAACLRQSDAELYASARRFAGLC